MKDPSCYHEIMDSAALVKAKMDDFLSILKDESQKKCFIRLNVEKKDGRDKALFKIKSIGRSQEKQLERTIKRRLALVCFIKGKRYSIALYKENEEYFIKGEKILNLKISGSIELHLLSSTFRYDLYDAIKDLDLSKDRPCYSLFYALYANEDLKQRLLKIKNGSLNLIWGPPGSGKSWEIVNLSEALLKENKSVLISANNNLSLDDLHSKLKDKKIDATRVKEKDDIDIKSGCILLMTVAKALIEIRKLTKEKRKFTALILDEAGMIKTSDILALSFIPSDNLYIYGDNKQLAPIYETKRDEIKMKSLFDLLGISSLEIGEEIPSFRMLRECYRMNSGILNFVSSSFYFNLLKNAKAIDERLKKSALDKIFPSSLSLLDISKYSSPLIKGKESYANFCVAFFSFLTAALFLKEYEGIKVGLASAYKMESEALRALSNSLLKRKERQNLIIDTVHSFQGKEVDVMVLSLSDSYPLDGLSPLYRSYNAEKTGESDRLLNVAISRSKIKFILVADFKFLKLHAESGTSLYGLVKMLDESDKKREKKLRSFIKLESETFTNIKIGLFNEKGDETNISRSLDSSWALRKAFWNNFDSCTFYISSFVSMTLIKPTLINNISRHNKRADIVYEKKGKFKIKGNKTKLFSSITEVEKEIPLSYAVIGDTIFFGTFHPTSLKEKDKCVPYIEIRDAKKLIRLLRV